MSQDFLKGLKRFEVDSILQKRILFLCEEWKRAFPGLDIHGEIQNAHYWLLTRGKFKKRNDIYLSNWMKKAWAFKQEKPVFGHLPKYAEQKPADEEIMTAEDFRKMREAL